MENIANYYHDYVKNNPFSCSRLSNNTQVLSLFKISLQKYYTLYTIHYTLYTIHYTLYTIHYTLYTIHYTLISM